MFCRQSEWLSFSLSIVIWRIMCFTRHRLLVIPLWLPVLVWSSVYPVINSLEMDEGGEDCWFSFRKLQQKKHHFTRELKMLPRLWQAWLSSASIPLDSAVSTNSFRYSMLCSLHPILKTERRPKFERDHSKATTRGKNGNWTDHSQNTFRVETEQVTSNDNNIIIIMRSLSAPSQLSLRRVQQTIKQKDTKFQTPKTHTQHTQIFH